MTLSQGRARESVNDKLSLPRFEETKKYCGF